MSSGLMQSKDDVEYQEYREVNKGTPSVMPIMLMSVCEMAHVILEVVWFRNFRESVAPGVYCLRSLTLLSHKAMRSPGIGRPSQSRPCLLQCCTVVQACSVAEVWPVRQRSLRRCNTAPCCMARWYRVRCRTSPVKGLEVHVEGG
jgi:hypothetical protein